MSVTSSYNTRWIIDLDIFKQREVQLRHPITKDTRIYKKPRGMKFSYPVYPIQKKPIGPPCRRQCTGEVELFVVRNCLLCSEVKRLGRIHDLTTEFNLPRKQIRDPVFQYQSQYQGCLNCTWCCKKCDKRFSPKPKKCDQCDCDYCTPARRQYNSLLVESAKNARLKKQHRDVDAFTKMEKKFLFFQRYVYPYKSSCEIYKMIRNIPQLEFKNPYDMKEKWRFQDLCTINRLLTDKEFAILRNMFAFSSHDFWNFFAYPFRVKGIFEPEKDKVYREYHRTLLTLITNYHKNRLFFVSITREEFSRFWSRTFKIFEQFWNDLYAMYYVLLERTKYEVSLYRLKGLDNRWRQMTLFYQLSSIAIHRENVSEVLRAVLVDVVSMRDQFKYEDYVHSYNQSEAKSGNHFTPVHVRRSLNNPRESDPKPNKILKTLKNS